MRLLRLQKHFTSSSKVLHSSPQQKFTLLDITPSPDLNLQVQRLTHEQSGAIIYNIKNNDPDNTFASVIRTLPQDDTGCPHILEHLACCGSQKYQIRDPFFNMLKRSVNTYMNAWTGQDFTAYPFSSPNSKDFFNLYQVYLDMSLKPILNQLDFKQEGWRWEYNEKGLRELKGIVLNQMKGSYQSSDRQLYIQCAKRLYAGTPFSYDSGGKPESIVKLQYNQVKQMHQYYYHPSNMAFYFYGNNDIKQNLDFLDSEYLSKYGNNVKLYERKNQTLFSSMPQKIDNIFHTVTSPNAQYVNIGVAYNFGQIKNISPVELICLNILEYLLLEGNQALFYKQFIQSGHADSFGMVGIDISSVIGFWLTLKNAKISTEKTLSIIQNCLAKLIKKGVDKNRLEQYVIQNQFQLLTPKKTQGINYLNKFHTQMSNRLKLQNLTHGRQNLNKAVEIMKDKAQMKSIVQKYLLNNNKKVLVRQQPKQQKIDSNIEEQALKTNHLIISQQQKQLQERQSSQATNSTQCLPKLKLQDLIVPILNQYDEKILNEKQRQVHFKIDNKNIHSVRFAFKLDTKNAEHKQILKYIDLWAYAIKKAIPVKGLTDKQVQSKLKSYCHDFKVELRLSENQNEVNVVFQAVCLKQTLNQYLDLLNKILHTPKFTKKSLQPIFRQYKSQKVEQLLDSRVMEFCIDYAASFVNKRGQNFDSFNNTISSMKVLKEKDVKQKFKRIQQILLTECEVTSIEHSNEKSQNLLQKIGIQSQYKKKGSFETIKQNNQLKPVSIAVTNSYDVNFCCQVFSGPEAYSKEHASLLLFLQILEQQFLHPKIREKGGAYGAKATFRQMGVIALYSYMDPACSKTFSSFTESIQEIMKFKLEQQKLQETKIKILGTLDSPVEQHNQFLTQILRRKKISERQQFRQQILNLQWKDALQIGKKYLSQPHARVVFGKKVPQNFTQQKLELPEM